MKPVVGANGFASTGTVPGPCARRVFALAFALSTALLLHPGLARSIDVSVVGELTREATLAPGGRVEGTIRIQNRGANSAEVRLYQTDYRFRADGASLYETPGGNPRSNARWIAFTPQHLTIPAQDAASVSYVIEVPAADTLSGTYWSMLMVEPEPGDGSGQPSGVNPAVNVGIRTVFRQAVQMVTNIGAGGTRDLRVLDSRVYCSGKKRLLRWDVENTGQVWIRPAVWAEVYGEDGGSHGKFDAGRGRLYPGCSVRFEFDLSALSLGRYTALVIADGGDDQVYGARYGLDLDVDCSGPIAAKPE